MLLLIYHQREVSEQGIYSMEFDLFSVGFDDVEQHELQYSFPIAPEGWDGTSYELTIVDVFPLD